MSDRVFYVAAQSRHEQDANGKKRITGYVPAKFLTLNGKPVVDPTQGGSQNAYIYADGSDKYKTRGEIANPNNYLIVPEIYTEQQAQAFAAEIARSWARGPIGQLQAAQRMGNSFWPNGSQDLQRHPQWGIPEDSSVPAFTGGASYHLGSVTRWAGLPETLSKFGGGIPHWISQRPPVESEFRGLSQHNYDDISKGFADAAVARNAASPISDFGYRSQAQYPAGQIGDGNGLGVGDWRFPFAGIDPMNPTQPVSPPQTDSKPAPRLVRVNGKTPPAWPAAPVAPSNNRNSVDNSFGNWISSPEGNTPRNPNQPLPPAEPGRPLGIFTGKPMPLWTTPPPLGGLLDHSGASGNDGRSTPLGGVPNGKKSATGGGVPAAPIAPTDNPYPAGGLAGWLATLAGVDPQNPTQAAPPPLANGLRDYYRDDPVQPWLLRGQR
jgi:hypothetical protein